MLPDVRADSEWETTSVSKRMTQPVPDVALSRDQHRRDEAQSVKKKIIMKEREKKESWINSAQISLGKAAMSQQASLPPQSPNKQTSRRARAPAALRPSHTQHHNKHANP